MPHPVYLLILGPLSLIIFLLNILFWCGFLIGMTFLKVIIPSKKIKAVITKQLMKIAENWIGVNNFNMDITQNINLIWDNVPHLKRDDWYIVTSNHQSWVDIVVLQRIFHRKIPFLKFFLKQELVWVPILGICWWALDFPFMKRFSRSFLEKNPHLKGKDLETTRKACEKFKTSPITVMNFLEGTRLTKKKQKNQKSPYNNLLKPKAGGLGFVLGAMGEQIQHILDVTIVYPQGKVNMFDLFFGNIDQIIVHVNNIPVTPDLIGDYDSDPAYKAKIQNLVNSMWEEKEERISNLKKKYPKKSHSSQVRFLDKA